MGKFKYISLFLLLSLGTAIYPQSSRLEEEYKRQKDWLSGSVYFKLIGSEPAAAEGKGQVSGILSQLFHLVVSYTGIAEFNVDSIYKHLATGDKISSFVVPDQEVELQLIYWLGIFNFDGDGNLGFVPSDGIGTGVTNYFYLNELIEKAPGTVSIFHPLNNDFYNSLSGGTTETLPGLEKHSYFFVKKEILPSRINQSLTAFFTNFSGAKPGVKHYSDLGDLIFVLSTKGLNHISSRFIRKPLAVYKWQPPATVTNYINEPVYETENSRVEESEYTRNWVTYKSKKSSRNNKVIIGYKKIPRVVKTDGSWINEPR